MARCIVIENFTQRNNFNHVLSSQCMVLIAQTYSRRTACNSNIDISDIADCPGRLLNPQRLASQTRPLPTELPKHSLRFPVDIIMFRASSGSLEVVDFKRSNGINAVLSMVYTHFHWRNTSDILPLRATFQLWVFVSITRTFLIKLTTIT